ncbi:MAG: DUF2764 family protein [Candidatus Omnitrophica bacterium]|nr:DUF2764 family protein [Candidatus Omnitrophota bacterium]
MANYYYFVASLPMLHLEVHPPFSYSAFLDKCREFLSKSDYETVYSLPETIDDIAGKILNDTVKNWLDFDSTLRNELIKIRAGRRHMDAAKYPRPYGYPSQFIANTALNAYRNPSIIEGERILDRARWEALTSLEVCHYFDIDFLICYAYKLKILKRWQAIGSADKGALLDKAIEYA